jgi:tRNA(Ile)-lysidine synthase
MIQFSTEILKKSFNASNERNYLYILCSSGIDSIATTHFLNRLYDIKAIHFNHGLREENDRMEAGFRAFTKKFEIESIIHKLDCNQKTEDGFRKARISWIKENLNNEILVTGHHLNDCVESYLLNVCRGKENFLPIPFNSAVGTNQISHPFILTHKTDFTQYCERNNLMQFVVEDSTNKEKKGSRRNFFRNEIIPLLQQEKMGLDTIVKKKILVRLAQTHS